MNMDDDVGTLESLHVPSTMYSHRVQDMPGLTGAVDSIVALAEASTATVCASVSHAPHHVMYSLPYTDTHDREAHVSEGGREAQEGMFILDLLDFMSQ